MLILEMMVVSVQATPKMMHMMMLLISSMGNSATGIVPIRCWQSKLAIGYWQDGIGNTVLAKLYWQYGIGNIVLPIRYWQYQYNPATDLAAQQTSSGSAPVGPRMENGQRVIYFMTELSLHR